MLTGVRAAKRATEGIPRRQGDIENPNDGQQGQRHKVQKDNMRTYGLNPAGVALVTSQTVLNGLS